MPTSIRTGAFAALLLAFALAGTAACRFAPAPVPADPGLNARLRADPVETYTLSSYEAGTGVDADPEAGRIYARHCARCHALWAPDAYHAEDWPRYVRRYAPRAGLFGQDRERVLRWLEAHAAR